MATNFYKTHDRYRLYILTLEDNCYYVGISTDPRFRYEQHSGKIIGGAEWTALHKPVKLLFVSDEIAYSEKKSEKIEELVTLELMKLVGREYVRGSHYSQVNQSTVDFYLGKERLKTIEIDYQKNKEKNFSEWSDKRIRKYFRELIFENQIADRNKEIKKT